MVLLPIATGHEWLLIVNCAMEHRCQRLCFQFYPKGEDAEGMRGEAVLWNRHTFRILAYAKNILVGLFFKIAGDLVAEEYGSFRSSGNEFIYKNARAEP